MGGVSEIEWTTKAIFESKTSMDLRRRRRFEREEGRDKERKSRMLMNVGGGKLEM